LYIGTCSKPFDNISFLSKRALLELTTKNKHHFYYAFGIQENAVLFAMAFCQASNALFGRQDEKI
jgi:hypothetical protein